MSGCVSSEPPAKSLPEDTNDDLRFIIANPLDLSQIQRMSRFRSCVGHDYSGFNSEGEKETLRSMKHYLEPLPSLIGTNQIKIFAPFDGKIVEILDGPPGKAIYIAANIDSRWRFIFFHVVPAAGIEEGTSVKAGEPLGTASKDIHNFDFALKKFGWSQVFDSPFVHMTETVLEEYTLNGITLENILVSKQARDADPCLVEGTKNGDALFTSYRDQDFVTLRSDFAQGAETDATAPAAVPEKTPDLVPPTHNLPTEPVADTLSFSWEKDGGSRVVDGSVPFVHGLKDGKVRLYYCNSKGILSAISRDGLTFTKEPGVRISPGTGFEVQVCDPTIVDLPNGKMRMYYKGANSQNPGPGQSIHKIYSALSSDGLTFQKEGLRIDSETNGDRGWASVPDAIMLPDGRVRLYYVTASVGEHGIGSAISSDGLNFVKEAGIRVSNLVDPAVVRIGSRYVLFAASIDERFTALPKGIYYLESSDGLEFGDAKAVFQANDVYDPSVLKIDEQTVRVFYGKVVPPQLPAVESHTGIVG